MIEKMPENMIRKMLEELRNTDIPVYIWGAEKLARKVKEYFEYNKIPFEGFLINKKFQHDNKTNFFGYPLLTFEEFVPSNKCNLVVAFDGYSDELLVKYKDCIHGVYTIDFMGMLCMDGFNSSIPFEFYDDHKSEFEWLEEHLNDEKSKIALKEYLVQKMSGRYVKDDYEWNQYFPDDIIQLRKQETFLNCGAYHGEITLDFISHLKKKGISEYKRIICIEADKNNYAILENVLAEYKDIELISGGVWNEDGILYIDGGNEETSRVVASGIEKIQVKTIDSILNGTEATYIKMDIEGSELKALQGAAGTIKKYKPKLAICVYHKPEDLIEIPSYIYSLRKDYKFYLRNHSPHGIEAVLYAV